MSHLARSRLALPRSQGPKTPNYNSYCIVDSEGTVGQLEIHGKGLSTVYIKNQDCIPGRTMGKKPK